MVLVKCPHFSTQSSMWFEFKSNGQFRLLSCDILRFAIASIVPLPILLLLSIDTTKSTSTFTPTRVTKTRARWAPWETPTSEPSETPPSAEAERKRPPAGRAAGRVSAARFSPPRNSGLSSSSPLSSLLWRCWSTTRSLTATLHRNLAAATTASGYGTADHAPRMLFVTAAKW